MAGFDTVSDDTIKKGDCTDIYFVRTEETLRLEKINPVVCMEVTASALPDDWAVFCGLSDVIALLEGIPVTVDAMPEGTVFLKNEPVLRISGKYRDFCRYETAILGFLCHASGVASAAAHITCAAYGRPVYSFGSRRQHPSIARMIERAAWIGGVEGVSNICAPEGMPVVGTMPHAFIMCYEKPEDAWRSFDKHAPKEVPRIMLCDTFCDEKTESLRAAELGATAVRLDTPRSRRGNMRSILEEVRWELDTHGYPEVRIFLSGGVTRDDIISYRDIVDAFGVGGAIANAPVIDFGMDIVEIKGVPKAKRGKRSGIKQVYLMPDGAHRMVPAKQKAPKGGKILIEPCIENGKILKRCDIQEARKRVLQKLSLCSE
ncbi:MAG: nicotinate phosphoribosyltransferase [Methanoregula sp.]|jgi:nicotinate phosphoribosyltransferase|nr:nicotinate phosphoribosyltransferase [Methanoregula sp.]